MNLTLFKRGAIEKKKHIFLNYNLKNIEFVKLLYKLSVIESYEVVYDRIKIIFKFYENKTFFNNLMIFTSCKAKKSIKLKKLYFMVNIKNKNLILLTTKGIIAGDLAIKYRIGGIILACF